MPWIVCDIGSFITNPRNQYFGSDDHNPKGILSPFHLSDNLNRVSGVAAVAQPSAEKLQNK